MIKRYGAAGLGLVAIALAVAGVLVHLATPATARVELFDTPESAYGPAAAGIAVLLLWRRPDNLIARLLLLSGLCAGLYVAGRAIAVHPGTASVLGAAAGWVARWSWAPAYLVAIGLIPLLWPDGRPPSPRWRPAVGFAVALLVVVVAGTAIDPAVVSGRVNPFGVRAAAPLIDVLRTVFLIGLPVLVGLAVAALVVRFRRADPIGRRQIAWFGYAVAIVAAVSFAGPWQLRLAASVTVPVAVGVAVTRYRLWDIDALVSRTLIGAAVLAALALVYIAVVGWAGAVLADSRTAAFAGAVAVALVFTPVRQRAERAVRRLLFGARADPYQLLTRVNHRLQQAASPAAALAVLAAEAAEGLRLPGVAVEVDGADGQVVSAVAGSPWSGEAVRLPLVWFGATIGHLSATPRRGTDRLDLADDAVLRELVRQASGIAYGVRLAADLQHARERIVTAREEERRRLRRDLHDGVGPQLAGVVMSLDAASVALDRGNAAKAAGLLHGAREHARAAVEDIRRVVRGLRPPILDDLGLAEALRSTGPAAGDGGPLISVETDGTLPQLPAAVEVAAFHVVQESLTNAVRHAEAGTVRVRLAGAAGALRAEVEDDGAGIAATATPGVGFASMRERVEELGGTLTVAERPGGGTRITALLPLPDAKIA